MVFPRKFQCTVKQKKKRRELIQAVNSNLIKQSQSMSRNKLNVVAFLSVNLAFMLIGSPAKAVIFNIGPNYEGITEDDHLELNGRTVAPPDPVGAAGINHFVQFTNGVYEVRDKNSGTSVQQSSDKNFWESAGVIDNTPGTTLGGDPRVLFDPQSNRWFTVGFDLNRPQDNINNSFLLAVSKSADPTQGWTGFQFGADPDGFTDFPTLGINSQGVYLGGLLFDATRRPLKNVVISIPKSDLVSPTPTIDRMTRFDPLGFNDYGYTIQPAVNLGVSSDSEPLLASDNKAFNGPSSQLFLANLSNTVATNASISSPEIIAVDPYSRSKPALQPDGSQAIATGQPRFSSSVKQVGNSLWGVGSGDNSGRSAIRWYEIDATTSAKLQEGTIDEPNSDFYAPSIAVNELGNVVIGFSASGLGDTQFPGAYAVVGETIGGKTTFSDPQLLKAGNTNYHPTDPTPFNEDLNDPNPVVERWGDYTETSIDPTNPNRFWVTGEFALDVDRWGTQITAIDITPTPVPEPPATLGLIILGFSGAVYQFTKKGFPFAEKDK